MGDVRQLRQLIKIYWYIIGGLFFLFICNCWQYMDHLYANPEMRCTVAVASKDNYVRFVPFSVRDDGSISFYSGGGTSRYRNIYTGDDDYINLDNYDFERRGRLSYYAIDEQKLYLAHIPPHVKKEIQEVLSKRRNTKKQIRHYFTIHPQGLVELVVKEVGDGDHYYKKKLPLYHADYQAESYSPNSILSQLDEALFINYSDTLHELLKKKYNWAVRIICHAEVSDKIRDGVKGDDIGTNIFRAKHIYGLEEYADETDLLLDNLKIGEQYITFDVPKMSQVFERLYLDADPSEKSYIKVQLSDSMTVKSIYLFKDNYKMVLPHRVTTTYW